EDANGRPFIETVPRRGYRFTADVRAVDASPERSRPARWAAEALGISIILVAGLVTWTTVQGRHTAADPLAGKKRIVVLPFENLTRDRQDDWLAGAFSDSLTIGLQDLDDVICISRDRIVELYG